LSTRTLLGAAVDAMMTATAWRSKRFSLWSAIGRGVVWAVAFHISASLLSVLRAPVHRRNGEIRTEKFSRRVNVNLGTAAGASLLLLVPWTARNYIRFGKLFYMRDNLGLELA